MCSITGFWNLDGKIVSFQELIYLTNQIVYCNLTESECRSHEAPVQ